MQQGVDPRRLDALLHYLTDLNSVTPAELQTLAQTYLKAGQAIPVLILPQQAVAEQSAGPVAAGPVVAGQAAPASR